MTEDKKIVIEHGILDLIEQDGRVTQTELARSLRVSIGLVNAYLRNLVSKGYVKVSNVKASTIKYMLTPEGLSQKYHLTRSYMTRSLDYYRRIKQAVESRILRLKLEEVRTVVFVGNGEIAEIMLLYVGDTKMKVLEIFSDDVKTPEERIFFGYKIRPMNELNSFLKDNDVDKILLNYFEEIEEKEKLLLSMGVESSKIDAKW
ncbi:MAG: winged helix-turn-helix transcriptional regulator [Pseudomonadota bacterium]